MFSNFFKKGDNVDYKARLERKLCLARETPEPIFDLSECKLRAVPAGVYSLCKVLRKEALFLNDNILTNLLSGGNLNDLTLLNVLDLHSNKLAILPEDIGNISCLESLNISDNHLTCIPNSIGKLKKLKKLELANNRLKQLPPTVGSCRALQLLNVCGNANLHKLPKQLAALVQLKTLLADATVQFPPGNVLQNGAAATVAFLAAELGTPLDDNEGQEFPKSVKEETDFFLIQEKLRLIEERKEVEKKQRLVWEKALAEDQIKDATMHINLNSSRIELIENIQKTEKGLEESLNKIQEQKDLQRLDLITQCIQMENEISGKVNAMLENARKLQRQMTDSTEKDRLLEEQLLFDTRKKSVALDKSAILDAMDACLKEDIMKAEQFQKYDNQRRDIAVNWANEQSEWSQKLGQLVEVKRLDSQGLTDMLMQDEELQKAAVASLMEQSDARTWNLPQQIKMVENQLAELTQVEIKRKKTQQEDQIINLCTNRIALAELLMVLFEQQQKRRSELVSALRCMEDLRGTNEEEFWLQQYQRLLESSSRQLVVALQAVDPDLHHQLALHGVSHCLPLLAEHLTSTLAVGAVTEEFLIERGISDADDRSLLLKAFKSYLEQNVATPSAPMPSFLEEPSAPLISPTAISGPSSFLVRGSDECVVCLESAANTLFIPCGHMCCCVDCSRLDLCPLCREPVTSTLKTSVCK